MPIRQGDGTGVVPQGIAEVRTGSGDVLYSSGGAIPDSGVFRWNCGNGNNDTSVVEDIWGNQDGTVRSATYDANGGNDGNGAYGGNCDIDVGISGMNSSASFAGWFYAPWSSGSGNRVVWNFDSNGRTIGVHYNNNNNSGGYELLLEGTSIPSNISDTQRWIHIVVTSDGGGGGEIYIDGNLENSGTTSYNSDSSGTLYISEAPAEGKNNDLRLAEFSQYDKVLNDTEVSNLYNTGSISG